MPDIRDAFHNVPAGKGRKFTVAAANMENDVQHFIAYMVLVFGSKSLPLSGEGLPRCWGAHWPQCALRHTPRYMWMIQSSSFPLRKATTRWSASGLTRAFLWTEMLGYPLKLSKAQYNRLDWSQDQFGQCEAPGNRD